MEGAAPRGANRLAAGIALVTLCGVWAWWAAKEGAYFGTVMYPGLVVLCAGLVLASSRTAWGSRLALAIPAKVALASMVGLAAWSALSATWSSAPDVAVADAQRILGYAVAFGLGLWLAVLSRDRLHLPLVPLAFAGLVAGAIGVVGLLTTEDFARFVDEGTLQFPLGYRNANAAFFLVALWPTLALAATRDLDWRLRAIALATATLCFELAALSQSRGSMVAGIVAVVVLLVASRDRANAVLWMALAAAPALIVLPAVTDLFQTADFDSYTGTSELRDAGRAALGGALVALAVGAAAALVARRRPVSPEFRARADSAVGLGAIGLAVAATLAFTMATGDPLGWIGDRVDEFLTQGSPGSDEGAATRFGVNAGSERDDLWRVALEEAGDEPLLGTGGGGFQYVYLRERSKEGVESLRDAHSVELEILSELGFPGLALFLLAIGGAGLGAWAARNRGPEAAALAACALTAGAYWLAHSSIDWFWTYAAVTAPVFALLGSACAAASTPTGDRPAGRWRVAGLLAAVLLALSVIPPYLAERYVDSAYDGWRGDPTRASDDLDRARALNPLSLEPLLAEGGIAMAQGDRARAIAAFEEAAEKRPDEWATHYFLAALTRTTDPARARIELELARERNPFGDRVRALGRRLERDALRSEAGGS